MRKLRHLDLFSGVGGFALGLRRAGGFETVAKCEIDSHANKVHEKHFGRMINMGSIENANMPQYFADIITGGFPCQPFSSAAHGNNPAVDLWPHMFRIIKQVEPDYVIAENVKRAPIERAAKALSELGYGTWVRCIPAQFLGAPHRRIRYWLCAYPYGNGELCSALDAEARKLPKLCGGVWSWENYARALRVSDGLPDRVDRYRRERIREMGNAVIPQIPEAIGRAIMAAEGMTDG